MASGGGEDQGNTWWGSLLKIAKEKSKTAMELIKTDLAEFTSTMTTDTSYLLSQAQAQLKEISSANLNFDNESDISEPIVTSKQDSSTNEIEKMGLSTKQDRFQKELENLQSSQSTYLNEPDQTNSEFIEWKSKFSTEAQKSIISELLIQNSSMRLLYSQLVPSQLTNDDFWSRYFYRVYLLEEENKKRVKLLERADNQVVKDNEQDTLDWDEDEHDEEVSNKKDDNAESSDKSQSENDPVSEIESKLENMNTSADLDRTLNENASDNEATEHEETNLKKVNKIEISQIRSEDGDDWDRVSDVGGSDNKKERSSSDTPSEEASNERTDTQIAETSTKKNNDSKKNSIEDKKTEKSDGWDNWDE